KAPATRRSGALPGDLSSRLIMHFARAFHVTHWRLSSMKRSQSQEYERANRSSRAVIWLQRVWHEVEGYGSAESKRCEAKSRQLSDVAELRRSEVELLCRRKSWQGHTTTCNYGIIDDEVLGALLHELSSAEQRI